MSTRSGNKKRAQALLDTVVRRLNAARRAKRTDVGSALAQFLSDQGTEKSAATVSIYRKQLSPLLEAWAGKPLSEWTPGSLREYIKARQAQRVRPWKPASVQVFIRSCRQFIQWAEGSEWPIPDFAEGVKPPRIHSAIPRHLSRGQLDALLDHTRGTDLEIAIALAGTMGLRGNEWGPARASDVNWGTGKITVRGAKVGRDRVLPIPPRVLRCIAHLEGTEERLVGNKYADAPAWMLGRLKHACTKAGVPRVSWRGLRHACGTLLAAKHPLHVVQRWLGHTKITTTAIYLHAQEDDLAAAAESMG